MRGGWFRGFAVLSLLLFAATAHAEEEFLFVDGKAAALGTPAISGDGGFLVPLREFGLLIGVDVDHGTDGSVALRWDRGRGSLQPSELPSIEGHLYVSLDWLVDLSGGVVRRLGNAVHIETEPASLSELDVSEERIVLRFDRFVPIEILSVDAASFHLRFHHCVSPFAHRSVALGSGPMAGVEARSGGGRSVDLVVSLRREGALRLTRFEASGFFSATVGVGEVPCIESVSVVDRGIRLYEAETLTSSGETRLAYVRVEDWRSRFRLLPAWLPGSASATVSLDAMATERGGIAAIGVDVDPDLLVIDGVPVSLSADEVSALVIDSFGRLSDRRVRGAVLLRVERGEIPLDGVNRPLRYGESVAYTPGYTGSIADRVPGGFTVLKLRSGRIVSVYHGTFIDRDHSATLIVASGEARAAFSGVSIGDDARLEYHAGPHEEPLANAVTINSVLFRDGIASDGGDVATSSRGWSVVATDRHGGLALLSISRSASSAGATVDELVDILRSFPVPIEDAFVLNAGTSDTLLLWDGGYHEFGGGDRVAVGLVLVPIDE